MQKFNGGKVSPKNQGEYVGRIDLFTQFTQGFGEGDEIQREKSSKAKNYKQITLITLQNLPKYSSLFIRFPLKIKMIPVAGGTFNP